MKTKRYLAGIVISGVSFFALTAARAQVEQVTADSGKDVVQGNVQNNGTTTIGAVTKAISVSTKTLLEDLALDETLAGRWFAKYPNKVPANAKLEVIYPGRADFSGLSYRVVSGTNVVDVSNVLTASATGTNQLTAGTHSDAKGTSVGPFSYTVYQEFTISYDARPLGGKLWFNVTGLATCSAKGGNPTTKAGKFLETDSFSLLAGTGTGVNAVGTNFITSGIKINATGSGQVIPPAQMGPISGDVFSEPGLQETSVGDGDFQMAAPIPPFTPAQLPPQ